LKYLTKQMQQTIDHQIYNYARDIDVARYNYLTGLMPNDMLIDCVLFFLAKDGGIANGLYIDNYNTNSSVYECYEALRILDEADINIDCSHEEFDYLMNKIFNYLYNRAEIVDNMWNPNVITNNNFAHSMEFEYNEENRLLFGYGPTAAILGYTLKLLKPTKAYYKKALKMIDKMILDFYNKESLTKYEFIGFNSFLKNIKQLDLYKDEQVKIEKHLEEMALKQVSTDFNNKSLVLPLDCASELNNKELNQKIDEQLDYIISSIAPHGLWDYQGSWGWDKYPEEDSAKLKWIGAISVNNYFNLKKYGRLE